MLKVIIAVQVDIYNEILACSVFPLNIFYHCSVILVTLHCSAHFTTQQLVELVCMQWPCRSRILPPQLTLSLSAVFHFSSPFWCFPPMFPAPDRQSLLFLVSSNFCITDYTTKKLLYFKMRNK